MLTALLSLAIMSVAQESNVADDKKLYVRTGNEGTLSGTIALTGRRPKARRLDMWADPICMTLNLRPLTQWVLGQEGKLANVFVYVKSEALGEYRFEMPTANAVLQHKGCKYLPHVLGIRVGQQLTILNNDPTTHNTHPTPKINADWNQSQPPRGEPIIESFLHSELFIPFKDNQHPWEKAYVSVFDHPFFAVSDEFGNYQIEGLPPGKYTVVAWHEVLGEKAIEMTLGAGEARDISFSFYTGTD
jgi:hypothetical protein